jgi:hypothetical protein
MSRKQANEALAEVKDRLKKDQTRRTEARIRQLLSPPYADEDSEEDSDREVVGVREERVVKGRKRREGEARESG